MRKVRRVDMLAQLDGNVPLTFVDERSKVCRLGMPAHASGGAPATRVDERSRFVRFDMFVQDDINSPLRL
jgi:hypothetical protein